jgi:hypothetical protein
MKELLIIPIVLFLLSYSLSSCNKQSGKEVDAKISEIGKIDSLKIKSDTDEDENPYTEYILGNEIAYDTSIAISRQETPYKGQLKRKYEWWDLGGLNRLILSSVYNYNKGYGRAEIFTYQYFKGGDKWSLVWQMNDFVDGMGCDLQIKLLDLQLKDIDKNGKSEVLIMYTLDERCDAWGVPTKLLMFIQNNKIAIRGISAQYLMPLEEVYNKVMLLPDDEPYKYKNIDPGVFPEDTIFVKYASDFWDNFIENENEEYKKAQEEFEKKQKEEKERKKLKRAKKNR